MKNYHGNNNEEIQEDQKSNKQSFKRRKLKSKNKMETIKVQIIQNGTLVLRKDDLSKKIEKKQTKRRYQPMWIYTLVIFATLVSGFQHLVQFYYISQGCYWCVTVAIYITTTFKIICWIISIIQIRPTWKKFFGIFWLVDPVFVCEVAASTVMVTLLYVGNARLLLHFILMGEIIIMNHLFTISFRLMLLKCQWNKAQVIIYKVSLTILCLFYIIFGSILLQNDFKYTNGVDPPRDKTFRQFLMLYVFMYMSYMFQMLTKFSDFDQTTELKSKYTLIQVSDDDEKQINEIDINEQIYHRKEQKRCIQRINQQNQGQLREVEGKQEQQNYAKLEMSRQNSINKIVSQF